MEWKPRTELGKMVAQGAITLDEIFTHGKKIKEAEIVDRLIPNLQSDIIFIGGSPGKGGGIKRTPTRRTTRMHRSGRRYRTSAMVVIGNGDGYFGIGKSVAVENRVAIAKATENAKLNIIPVKRGCGSWECVCGSGHTIPVQIEGKSGSVRVQLFPAPKGVGLCVNNEAKKMMRLAGIKDLWTKRYGESRSRSNYAMAVFDAFKRMNRLRLDSRTPAKVAEKNYEEIEEEAE
ncbi:MAG TPA: 30S ribosomal protein S5 [Candidatus Aenigmarchaeota archaeon]|nr:30S ribosomal protein S5 [Candidatus Aenigmarchaeota archaeon]